MLNCSNNVFFVSSFGGHSTQLGILKSQLNLSNDVKPLWVGTSSLTEKYDFIVPDCHGRFSLALVKCLFSSLLLCIKYRPFVVVSTGALPGLVVGLVSKLFGARFVWIDSIANIKSLSVSGTYALKFADEVYSQWPEVASLYKTVQYKGSVFE